MASSARPLALLFATSGRSGVDRVVSNLVRQWAGNGEDFDVLRIQGHGPRLDELPVNFTDVRLPCRHRDTVLPGLVRYLRRERPLTLLTAGHKLNRAALIARSLSRVDCCVVIRMGMSLSAKEAELSRWRSRRLFASMRRWYPRADAVITPSAGVAGELEHYAGLSPERLYAIPNPIVDDRLQQWAHQPVDEAWFRRSDRPVILGVGALEPRKDFPTLLRAFAQVRGQGYEPRLVILGEGPQRGELAGLAEQLGVADYFWLPGYVSNPYPYMAAAAVFALSSRREGSGAVLVEALACGTPVVSTDCPHGPRETLQHGRVAPLVPVGDPERLADALATLLSHRPDAGALRQAASVFDARRAAERYLEAISPRLSQPT
jgi:glycosyltransferase involved in cell wall biosynthesis